MHDYLDIIIFAVIAVGLLWRLRSVLGDRNDSDIQAPPMPLRGHDAPVPPRRATAPAATLVDAPAAGQERWAQSTPDFAIVDSATAHNRLSQFLVADPSFRPAEFLEKAKKAFGQILAAYAGGNRTTLGYLLTPDVLAAFSELLDARAAAGETYATELHDIARAVISDAELDGTYARVTVDFVAEQGITHTDREGRIMGGNDGHRRKTRDRWVFAKDLKEPGPTWLLAAILAHED